MSRISETSYNYNKIVIDPCAFRLMMDPVLRIDAELRCGLCELPIRLNALRRRMLQQCLALV